MADFVISTKSRAGLFNDFDLFQFSNHNPDYCFPKPQREHNGINLSPKI